MEDFIRRIENVNLIIYDTLHKGRDFYGEEWSDSSIYKAGLTYARVCFLMFSAGCRKYLDFAKFDFYWDNLWKELQLKEVESAGYVNRMQKYFEKFSSKILKADYDKLIKSVFIRDLLNDGYISQGEAEEYCRLLEKVHDKALNDAIRFYKIILCVTSEDKAGRTDKTVLDDEVFNKVFQRAIEAGYIKKENGAYKWTKSNALLAYVCGRVFCGDSLQHDTISNKDYVRFGNNDFLPEKALNELFGIENLGTSRYNLNTAPRGYKNIELLFD